MRLRYRDVKNDIVLVGMRHMGAMEVPLGKHCSRWKDLITEQVEWTSDHAGTRPGQDVRRRFSESVSQLFGLGRRTSIFQ